jgi:hypothetical protein
VDEARVLEDGERVEELRGEDLDELDGEPLELVLLDELVQVRGQELEDEAEMVLVDERVPHAQDVVLVVRVAVLVQLWDTSAWAQSECGWSLASSRMVTSIMLWLKYAGLFLTTLTATISCDFTFWHLTTWPNVPCPNMSNITYLCTPSAYIHANVSERAHEPVLFFGPEYVVYVEDVVVVLVVKALVVGGLARLCEHAPGVLRALVAEVRVAESVGLDKLHRQLLQRLYACSPISG